MEETGTERIASRNATISAWMNRAGWATHIFAATGATETPVQCAGTDLRPVLKAERLLAPMLMIAAAGAAVAAALGSGLGGISGTSAIRAWVWFAAMVLATGLRLEVARRYADSREVIAPGAGVGRMYLLLHAIELTLWLSYFAWLLAPQPVALAVAGASAAASLFLQAWTLSAMRAALLAALGAWLLILSVGAWRMGSAGLWLTLGVLPWLAAAAWVGWSRGVKGSSSDTRHVAGTLSKRTRFGWRAAVHAVPTPLIVVRHGRVVDVNEAAASFLGCDELPISGRAIEDCIDVVPADALLPLSRSRGPVNAQVRPKLRTFESEAWSASVRVLSPGDIDSVIVIALAPPATTPESLALNRNDAYRMAAWLGGERGFPWFRDEHGHVFLPSEFGGDLNVGGNLALEFPLLSLVETPDRQRVQAAWQLALSGGRVFDEPLRFTAGAAAARAVRVTALLPANASANSPVIGMIAPLAEGAAERAALPSSGDDLLARLPVLVWVVDWRGHVVRIHGADPWRWGKTDDEAGVSPLLRPWHEAFAILGSARISVARSLRQALQGKPTFDVINRRGTRSGGRVVLRSYFMPLKRDGDDRIQEVLVLDTIASPQQLAEIDRLRRSKAQYRALVESSTSLIWAVDSSFKITFASRRAARDIYSRTPTELIGQSVGVLLAPGVDQSAARHVLACLRIGQSFKDVEMIQQAKDGQRVIVSVSARPLMTNDGTFVGALGMNVDLTMLKQRERRLAEALRVERTVLDSAGQAIAVIKDGRVARCNDAFLDLMEATPTQMARTQPAEYFTDSGAWQEILAAADAERDGDRATVREVQIRRGGRAAAAATSWCQLTARAIAPNEYVVVLTDIDHLRQREADALHDAHHDDLTGLPNRRLLAIRAAGALSASGMRQTSCAVLALDLDGFKQINDRYGHKVGDAVLREMAARLEHTMRPQDTVARRGGDEFAVLVPDAGSPLDIERIAERILAAVVQPITLPSGGVTHVSVSIGVAVAPQHGREFERLMQLADLAMYEAKLSGKNRFTFALTSSGTLDHSGNVTALVPRAVRANGVN